MGIRYDNKRVKRPFAETEYNLKQIQALEKCYTDFWEFVKYVKIINADGEEVYFEARDYQKNMLNMLLKNNKICGLWPRQCGKTTVVCVYALWFALFNSNKIIGIVSNKERSAKMILGRLKKMYEMLPIWVKPGVTNYAETSVTFDNGTKLLVSATSDDAFRGETINLLICDELAFVPKNKANAFWHSNQPTISASKKSKVIIISTPCGMYNLFHRIYSDGKNGNSQFKTSKITWRNVPGRDEEWAEEQIKELGKIGFNQEHECITGNTIIKIEDTKTGKIMNMTIKELYNNIRDENDSI